MPARTRLILLIFIVAVAVVVAYLYLYPRNNNSDVLRASGIIEATEVDAAFQIGGKVVEVAVREGQSVKQEDVLARMAAEELEARGNQIQASLDGITSQTRQQQAALEMRRGVVENQIRQARGQADAARMVAERLREGSRPQEIRVAEAAVTQAQAELERRRNEHQRMAKLLEAGAISKQEYDVARTTLVSAESALQTARERLALTREGPRREEIAEADARLRSAEAGVGIAESGRKEIEIQQQVLEAARARERELRAQLEAARIQLGYTEVRSPLDGVVLLKNVESGEVVSPGTPVVTVGDIQNLWMNIYIPETQTGLVKLGQSVSVRVDSFPDETFGGKVTFISSESEFTPKTIQTLEERVKLVYRVKVSLENAQQKLKPGMPADAEIQLR
ncbi:MAG: efflux RND transporter periplasmic adaptor subunit [Acidobacteria bacterium]|nr:efflux RND transporter periplasmic adaptor subunit [Acidobacteriota bacterium]